MLRQEHETLKKREQQENAFQAAARKRKGSTRQGNSGQGGAPAKNSEVFRGRCFLCKKTGHRRRDCPNRKKNPQDEEHVFAVNDSGRSGVAWVLDSGASVHMTFDREDFIEYRTLVDILDVTVANGQRLRAAGAGLVRLVPAQGKPVTLTEVLHVPRLDRKLMSIPATSKGASCVFEPTKCIVYSGNEQVLAAEKYGKMYLWRGVTDVAMAAYESVSDKALWHARLGHIGDHRLSEVCRRDVGVPSFSQSSDEGVCEGCACGKLSVCPFGRQSGSEVKSSGVLELIHSDVMGPMNPVSKSGAKVSVAFIDDYSRYVHVYSMKSKGEVLIKFKEYKNLVENQTGRRIQTLRTDNGGEYTSRQFSQFLASCGIKHQKSAPYSPTTEWPRRAHESYNHGNGTLNGLSHASRQNLVGGGSDDSHVPCESASKLGSTECNTTRGVHEHPQTVFGLSSCLWISWVRTRRQVKAEQVG
ncbi:TPA: hypothetical protein N0F65_009389 [Lagenidium giganteum]|uniref:Polyprotein n=1 Tax=Lagenidium giganteum TaxID=4803 RepID=A0AAV2ZBC3_9STRA|nr:TPA: hypothetical protein N0F65_009389 [Lagenidium giganteum]